MEAENNFRLSELIDSDSLQKILESFCDFTGIGASIADADYSKITKPTRDSSFCHDYTRNSEIGLCMCEECDRFGAEESMKSGEPFLYRCHANMIEFTAPIIVNGHFVGSLLGGQILSEPPVEAEIKELAEQYGIDPDDYWKAVQDIPVMSEKKVQQSVEFLQSIAEFISGLAYSKYISTKANEELEQTAKMQADFLANMSHEIRTPMNAITGFTEMALRESTSPVVKDYLEQIKRSGEALITIINDILDFSKIRSNKLDIIKVSYEPLSIIDDIAGVAMTRLADSDVELMMDLDPNIPCRLEGDNNRIRQVLLNLISNATKFTKSGTVTIKVDFEWIDYENISLNFAIIDTGIGIKPENLELIFESFRQVDSKRNRNIEGTGLGLAITKNLLKLMGSDIKVESTYGSGSTFSFKLIQKVLDSKPSVMVEHTEKFFVGGAFASKNIQDNFLKDVKKLGVETFAFDSDSYEDKKNDIFSWLEKKGDKEGFYFIEQQTFDPDLLKFHKEDDNTHIVLLAETFSDVRNLASKNIMVLRKPLSVMNLGGLFNNRSIRSTSQKKVNNLYNFTAEDASILIVDDNTVNLAVAKGLLEPLKASIDTSISGLDAIHKIREKKYDLIFMDHMMPEMDGVEATHIIRKDYIEYKNVPIIALSANAMAGAKEMFISEGMDDFIPKPVEVKSLIATVNNFLPQDKIKYSDESYRPQIPTAEEAEDSTPKIGNFDTAKAIELLGSESLFENVLKIYYESIDQKASDIKSAYDNKDWKNYTIMVHALKSSSRQIGAMDLGELAYKLEMAGKNQDLFMIERDTDALLKLYDEVKKQIAQYYSERNGNSTNDQEIKNSPKKTATRDVLDPIFELFRSAADDLDMDGVEQASLEMEKYDYPEMWQEKYKCLKTAVRNMDTEEIIDILDSWF